jgi:hypothetical protein
MSKYQIFKKVDFKKITTPVELNSENNISPMNTHSKKFELGSHRSRNLIGDNGIIKFYKR